MADIGTKARLAIPHIKKLLDSTEYNLRMIAVYALGEIACASDDVLTSLRRLRTDPDAQLRKNVEDAIQSITRRR